MFKSSGRSHEMCSPHDRGLPQALLGQQIYVKLLEPLAGVIKSEIRLGNPSSAFAPFPCEIGRSKHSLECICESTFIFRRDEQASLSVTHELWITPDARGDDGATSGHRFEDRIRKALRTGRADDYIQCCQH